jgi:hypothetical protein
VFLEISSDVDNCVAASALDGAPHAALRGVLVRLRQRPGLFAFVADLPDDEDPPEVATYCPPCAEKHFDAKLRQRDYT